MRTLLSTAGLARLSARRPWFVIAAWVVLLVFAGVATTSLGDAFSTGSDFTGQPESVRADDLLKDRLRSGQDQPVTETVIVHSDTTTVDAAAFRQVVEQTAADLRALPEVVANVTTYYEAVAAGAPEAGSLVSADKGSTPITVTLVGDFDQASEHVDAYLDVIARQGVADIKVVRRTEGGTGHYLGRSFALPGGSPNPNG